MPESGPGLMRAHLISRPTPLEAAPRLAQAIGLEAGDLWIKRDDLTGLGGGGNKARKLAGPRAGSRTCPWRALRGCPDPEQAVARLVGGLSGDSQSVRLRLRF